MRPLYRNILAVAAGVIVGGVVNLLLLELGYAFFPLPSGVVPADIDSLRLNMQYFEPQHFIAPFVAHAVGTLVGSIICVAFAASKKWQLSFIVAGFFLFGGIINAVLLPSPLWFSVIDLVFAYLPMAWLGALIAGARK
jgi:hypothetical protein